MSTVMITLRPGVDARELDNAKKAATEQGGKIVHESKLIKSITVEFPADSVHTMATNDCYTVEHDQEMTTQ